MFVRRANPSIMETRFPKIGKLPQENRENPLPESNSCSIFASRQEQDVKPLKPKIMKKLLLTLWVALISLSGVYAMSYEEAREKARFLTDKMAYELNLNDAQYNDAYEINLDYLMGIRTADDVYGSYLAYRNADLRHILYDWQYALFTAADYFFHPVYWRSGAWFFPVYNRYHVGVFYYERPRVFWEYRGGHGRIHHPHASFYTHRRPAWHSGFRGESRRPVNPPSAPGPGRPNGNHRPGNPGKHPGNNGYLPHNDGQRPGNGGTYRGNVRPDNQRPNSGYQQRNPRGNTTRSGQPVGSTRQSGQPQAERTHSSSRPITDGGYRRQSSTRTTVNRGRPIQRTPSTPAQSSGASRRQNTRR